MYWDPSGTSVLGEVFHEPSTATFRSERERVPVHAIPLPPRTFHASTLYETISFHLSFIRETFTKPYAHCTT